MKKVTKFLMAALLSGMCSFVYSQDYYQDPKPNEKILEVMTVDDTYREPREWYLKLLKAAQDKYPLKKGVDIRKLSYGGKPYSSLNYFNGPATGTVVYIVDAQTQWKESVSPGVDKAFRNVREGSRIAIDQVTVLNGMDREELKDRIIDILLDKGYKIIAKEYLDKLYEEQQAQQSGIYNDRTTVQENNFSAVGYYINVKVTETSLRVQVVNVSTGEYEGNATVNF